MTHLDKFRKAVEGLFDDWIYHDEQYLVYEISDLERYAVLVCRGREGFEDRYLYTGDKLFLKGLKEEEVDILWKVVEKRINHDNTINLETRSEVFKKFNLPIEEVNNE